jgi:hypothetical protein
MQSNEQLNLMLPSHALKKVTTRLIVSYFNWIWRHSRLKTTAAQRAKLTAQDWTWHDIVTYPTII